MLHAYVVMRNPNHTPTRGPAEPGCRNRPAMDRFIRPPQHSWSGPYAYDAWRRHTRTNTTNAGADTDRRTCVYDCSPPLSARLPAVNYTYGPHGECSPTTGTFSEVNPQQSASYRPAATTDFHYYGLRYYNPAEGRWLSRDPIQEKGGRNIYGFVGNNPTSNFDSLGLTNPNVPNVGGQPDFSSFPGVTTVTLPFYTGNRAWDEVVAQKVMQQTDPGWEPPDATAHHFSGNGIPQIQYVDQDLHESTYPHVGGFNFSQGYGLDRNAQFNNSQVVPPAALAAVMAINGLRGFLGNYLDRTFIGGALASCNQQKGSNPSGCGCCKITIIKQWEYPGTSGRIFGFGPTIFSPPGGESWIVGAYGDYASGSCDKHPQKDTPALLGGENKTQEAYFIKF